MVVFNKNVNINTDWGPEQQLTAGVWVGDRSLQ